MLNGLAKSLTQLYNSSLEGTVKDLEEVQKGINLGDLNFTLISDNGSNESFLDNVKFKYDEKEETFSINELIGKLEELGLIKKGNIGKLEPIILNEITKKIPKTAKVQQQSQQKTEQEDALDVNKYKEKLQGYINALNGIIKAIDSIPGSGELNDKINELNDEIQTFKSNQETYKNEAKKALGKLGKTTETSDDLKTQLKNINQGIDEVNNAKNKAVNNLNAKIKELNEANSEKERLEGEKSEVEKDLSTANSRVKRLIFATCASCIATLVSLGCVFQNELKNACDTVYKKVLELKNKMLG